MTDEMRTTGLLQPLLQAAAALPAEDSPARAQRVAWTEMKAFTARKDLADATAGLLKKAAAAERAHERGDVFQAFQTGLDAARATQHLHQTWGTFQELRAELALVLGVVDPRGLRVNAQDRAVPPPGIEESRRALAEWKRFCLEPTVHTAAERYQVIHAPGLRPDSIEREWVQQHFPNEAHRWSELSQDEKDALIVRANELEWVREGLANR